MRLSFHDKESFNEATESLRFQVNNPPSDPNMPPQLAPQGQEIGEDI